MSSSISEMFEELWSAMRQDLPESTILRKIQETVDPKVFGRSNGSLDCGTVPCRHLLGAAIHYRVSSSIVQALWAITTNAASRVESAEFLIITRAPRLFFLSGDGDDGGFTDEEFGAMLDLALRREHRIWVWEEVLFPRLSVTDLPKMSFRNLPKAIADELHRLQGRQSLTEDSSSSLSL